MDRHKAEFLADDLKNLACESCTKGWLDKHDGLTDPIQDINNCATFGLISTELRERLINEVKKLKN